MSYQVAARRYRPQNFAAIKGQELTVRALRNSVRQDKIHHAILLTGLRGCGKTSLARIYAKALNCIQLEEGEPCGKCSNCLEIAVGSSLSVQELDGASNNSVQDVRDLLEVLVSLPSSGYRYRVFIIDEVHMLTQAAFNALLKSLEEPPKQVVFILATTEPQKIPDTVLSRCLRFDLSSISNQNIIEQLREICADTINLEERALQLIAELAEGSMRDAISMLERVTLIQDSGDVTEATVASYLDVVSVTRVLGVLERLFSGEVKSALEELSGVDPIKFVSSLARLWRQLVFVEIAKGSQGEFFERYLRRLPPQKLIAISSFVTEQVNLIYRNHYPRLALDAFLVALAVHYDEYTSKLISPLTVPRSGGASETNSASSGLQSNKGSFGEKSHESPPPGIKAAVRPKSSNLVRSGNDAATIDKGAKIATPANSAAQGSFLGVAKEDRGEDPGQNLESANRSHPQDHPQDGQFESTLDKSNVDKGALDVTDETRSDTAREVAVPDRDPESVIAEFRQGFSRIDRQFLDNCQMKYVAGTIYLLPKNKFTKLHLESLDQIREGTFSKDNSIKVAIVSSLPRVTSSQGRVSKEAAGDGRAEPGLKADRKVSTNEEIKVGLKTVETREDNLPREDKQQETARRPRSGETSLEDKNLAKDTVNSPVTVSRSSEGDRQESRQGTGSRSQRGRLAKDHPAANKLRVWSKLVEAFPESEFYDV